MEAKQCVFPMRPALKVCGGRGKCVEGGCSCDSDDDSVYVWDEEKLQRERVPQEEDVRVPKVGEQQPVQAGYVR